jgi:hypothetical protein
MNVPGAGELNRRAAFYRIDTVSADDSDATNRQTLLCKRWVKIEPVGASVWAGSVQVDEVVTHRIWVRQEKGVTRPQDLTHMIEVESEGIRYLAKRAMDLNGAHTFTLLECEQLIAGENKWH